MLNQMNKSVNITYYFRKYKELMENKDIPYNDVYHVLAFITPTFYKALLNKSFKEEDICQILAVDEKNIVGAIGCCFTNQIIANGDIIPVQSGSYLFVEEEYRKYVIGIELLMHYQKLHPSKNSIASGISKMALPLYKILKYNLFEFPRFIFLIKSRSVVQAIFKLDGCLLTMASAIIDCGLWIYRQLLFIYTGIKTRKLIVEKTKIVPDTIEKIVLSDKHIFKELHNREWFEWNLNYTLSSDSRNKKALYLIKKGKEIIGFFITKMEFHEEASSRGFKNVYLGSVMEWGSKDENVLSETTIHLLALKTFPPCIDGVQMATSSTKTQKVFKRMGFVHVGDANMAVFVKSVKEEGIKDINNWRIRLAASDTLIN